MEIKPVLTLALGVCLQLLFLGAAFSETPATPCQSQLAPLAQTKNAVIEDGGIWALFERFKPHRSSSGKAIQLDSKVQQLVWLLDYLCETMEGVPLNDLATYVTQNLNEKSKKEFKAELLILGKTPSEIDIWFTFADISLKNEHRKLNPVTLRHSFKQAFPLLLQYKALAEEVEQSPHSSQIENVDELYRKIEQLESSDTYLIQALTETFQVPYWDINESTGGS